MKTAKDLLARTREKMMRSLDVSSNGTRPDRSGNSVDSGDQPRRRSTDRDIAELEAPDRESEEDEFTVDSEEKKRRWNWKKALQKSRGGTGGAGSPGRDLAHRRRSTKTDSREQSGVEEDELSCEYDDDAQDDMAREAEAYTQEYDDAEEDNYRVHARNNWHAKVADSKYWKKLMRQPLREADKKPPVDSWDVGLQALGDVDVSSKYCRVSPATLSSTFDHHTEKVRTDRRDHKDHRAHTRNQNEEVADVDVEVDPDAAYEGSSDENSGSFAERNVGEVDDGIYDSDTDGYGNTVGSDLDDGSGGRQRRSLRYFADQDDDDVHTAGNFSRASRHGSQHSNSSAMSIGATGLPTNVQPFRWVPYYGGANGFGYNPFMPYRQQQQQQRYPNQASPGHDHPHPPQTPGGVYDYDMGFVSSSATPTPQVHRRDGTASADYVVPSVSPGNPYSVQYMSPSPAVGQNGGRLSAAETPTVGAEASDGRISTALATPTVYDTYGSIAVSAGGISSTFNANEGVLEEGRRRHEAEQRAGMVDVLGIGAAAPASPAPTPAMASFYGPIGSLGLEASEKRRKLEASTGTEGHTVRAYRLAAAYPDLANLCGDGILMMTRMWCEPSMLTGARRVATPDLPELKIEDVPPGSAAQANANTVPVATATAADASQTAATKKNNNSNTSRSGAAASKTRSGDVAGSRKQSLTTSAAEKKQSSRRQPSGGALPSSQRASGQPAQQQRRGSGVGSASRLPSQRGGSGRVSQPSSFHSMMGGSVYLEDGGNQMNSSMMGSMAMDGLLDDFAGMEGSYIVDGEEGEIGSQRGEGSDGDEVSSGHDSSSAASSTSSSASSVSSDEDEDGREEPVSVVDVSTFGPGMPNRSVFDMGPGESTALPSSASAVSPTTAQRGKALPSRPSPTKVGSLSHLRTTSAVATTTAATAQPAASSSSKPGSMVSVRDRVGSTSTNSALYEYGLDVSFNQYLNPGESTKEVPEISKGTKAATAIGAAIAKAAGGGETVKQAAVTTKTSPTPPVHIARTSIAQPTAAANTVVKPTATATTTTTTATATATKPTTTTKPVAPSAASVARPSVGPTATNGAAAAAAAVSAPKVTCAGTSAAAAEANLDDLALKRRNSKFLSNDLNSRVHEKGQKLAPLARPPSCVASSSGTTTGPSLEKTASHGTLVAKPETRLKAPSPTPSPSSLTPTTSSSTMPSLPKKILASTTPDAPGKSVSTGTPPSGGSAGAGAPTAAPTRRVARRNIVPQAAVKTPSPTPGPTAVNTKSGQ